MRKVEYVLMAKGYKEKVTIGKKIYDLKEKWNVPYYSKQRYVIGTSEEDCYRKIREHFSNKYTGFRVLKMIDMESVK